MRALVVEDEAVSAMLLKKELESLRYEVLLATGGREALALIRQEDIRLVLTDWNMPEMDGIQLCQEIRASSPDSSYRYVIMLSSRDTPEDRERAADALVDDYLIKPINRRDLRVRLQVARRVLDMQDRLEQQNQDLRQSEAELVATNQQLTEATAIAEFARNRSIQLFEDLPVAGFTYDTECRIFEWNRRAEQLFEIPSHVAMGRAVWDVLGAKLVGAQERRLIQGVFQGRAFEEAPWSDGEIYLLMSSYPFASPSGQVTGAVATAVDVTPLRRAEIQIAEQKQHLVELNQKLQALAVTDALTGIPNHRAFQERLLDVVSRAERGRIFSLAMLDVDHFKHFNDTYGHRAGDEVLRKTAECLASNLRGADFIARYGGEEFAIVFEGIDEETAVQLCDRLRERISEIETAYCQITASFGVATYGRAASSPEELISCADQALYDAKRRGRNRVRGHSEMTAAA